MTSNTAGPSRRERMRAETIGEIKASARRQLLEHGPSGVSLRAIAREVGVTPAALYRYFDNLEALLTDLCCDFYDELIEESRQAMDAAAQACSVEGSKSCHLERMKAWIWSFRSWAVSNRREFELMLSLPGGDSALSLGPDPVGQSLEDLDPVYRKSIEHSQMCGGELAAFYRETEGKGFDFDGATMPEISEGLQAEIMGTCAGLIIGDEVPLTWAYNFVSGWVRVFGLVVMEAFGSLPVQEYVDEFYTAQIQSMMKDFGISP
ncbi:TetR/AcrR family transcriptional regulator [Glycomyces buryatensis]|uniref:TetR/AcrR family transcriptional regulator n=1 Tax=Glycomyces buryatensis TaxID=2570927 RepID=A0A4S8QFR4_9ACTN|nr:TetR/AcrR family transcriptional regulator [Glycomyces buryatensis]THV43258.1 TetR/AcrR family transcriptional regulator [Glycomyces buryatensis]